MKTLDLFSGIGGFSLAASWVWGEEHNIHAFVEIDPFCQKVLKKHWPNIPIFSDIKEYKHDGTTIDLLHGGPPCQPASCAGKQRGKQDDRWLWEETFRVVRDVKPTWCIFENVKGLLTLERGMVFENLLLELEALGYETESFIIPACGVGAPHRRDRVWIVANAVSRGRRAERQPRSMVSMDRGKENNAMPFTESACCGYAPNTPSRETQPTEPGGLHAEPRCETGDATDAQPDRLQGGLNTITGEGEAEMRRRSANPSSWDEPWVEAATRLCRVDDGIPRQMDRTKRLKALGNAIIPQAVVPIMQAIKQIMEVDK